MKRITTLIVSIVTSSLLCSCATIMNGTKQSVGISSVPTGALVTVDGKAEGTSPVLVNLSRKKAHLIKVEVAGFQPFELYTKRKYSGWLWGNILLGGLIGLAVDTGTGALYKIAPVKVNANLIQKTARDNHGDTLYLEAVLTPDPSWEKIGMLKKAS